MVDDLGLAFDSVARVRQALRNFVDQQMEPGDLLATETPAGVGLASNRFLRPNDVVRVEIDQLGAIENRFAPEAR